MVKVRVRLKPPYTGLSSVAVSLGTGEEAEVESANVEITRLLEDGVLDVVPRETITDSIPRKGKKGGV